MPTKIKFLGTGELKEIKYECLGAEYQLISIEEIMLEKFEK